MSRMNCKTCMPGLDPVAFTAGAEGRAGVCPQGANASYRT